MGANIRRVVTGHDAEGNATIASDGITPVIYYIPQRPGYSANEIWATFSAPARIDDPGEPTQRPRSLEPPANGTVFRICEFPPEAACIATLDQAANRAAFAAFGSPHVATEMENPPHPLMHRSKTVDYGIVLTGEITLVVDKGETRLKPGDVVVQRGTNHAWANRSDKPCRMAFILVDGEHDK